MKRMRTATGVVQLIRDQDPGTAITVSYVRRIINSGSVNVTHVGNKMLVDADEVLEYIYAEGKKPRIATPTADGIRPVAI